MKYLFTLAILTFSMSSFAQEAKVTPAETPPAQEQIVPTEVPIETPAPVINIPSPIVAPLPPVAQPIPTATVVNTPSKEAALPNKSEHKNFGLAVDVGVPDGLAIGFAAKPNVPWLRLELAATYNILAPGIRGGVTIDPINFFIAPTFTLEAGHSFYGTIPSKSAQVDLTYVNFHPGVEFGTQKSFRFFIHAGPTFINATGNNLESLFDNSQLNVKLNNTSVNGWITPTAKMGFVYFL
jgi:hypothetical protein